MNAFENCKLIIENSRAFQRGVIHTPPMTPRGTIKSSKMLTKNDGFATYVGMFLATAVLLVALFAGFSSVFGAASSSVTSQVIVGNAAPTVSAVSLNHGNAIVLNPNATRSPTTTGAPILSRRLPEPLRHTGMAEPRRAPRRRRRHQTAVVTSAYLRRVRRAHARTVSPST